MPTPEPPVWTRAIARLLTAKHYRSQAAFIAAARKRKIHIRPNTLSDVLRADTDTVPNLDTLITIAAALDAPLWALFCEPEDYARVLAAQRAPSAVLLAQLDALRAKVDAMRQETAATLAEVEAEPPRRRRTA